MTALAWEDVVRGVVGVAAVVAGIVLWIYSAYRVSTDARLAERTQSVASLLVLLFPFAALVYWLSLALGQPPFFVPPSEGADRRE